MNMLRTFPLVRHLSVRTTPLLLRLPISPNQITWASLVLGLLAAWCFAMGKQDYALLGNLALIVSYVLDNCDGEVARAKGLHSEFGRQLDDIADWLVHAALFLAIGHATEQATQEPLWWWLGCVAAAGATINYTVVRVQDWLVASKTLVGAGDKEPDAPLPKRPLDIAVFVFRELFRADFCFVLLVFVLLDATWALLPLAATGSQVYWIAVFVKGARRYHV